MCPQHKLANTLIFVAVEACPAEDEAAWDLPLITEPDGCLPCCACLLLTDRLLVSTGRHCNNEAEASWSWKTSVVDKPAACQGSTFVREAQ